MEITCGTSLTISYDCAAKPPCAANANGCPAFTKGEVDAIRSLIKPYVQKGILCGFGYRQGANNILGAQYATQQIVDAFTITKRPNHRFDVLVRNVVETPDEDIDFSETKEFVLSFLKIYFDGNSGLTFCPG